MIFIDNLFLLFRWFSVSIANIKLKTILRARKGISIFYVTSFRNLVLINYSTTQAPTLYLHQVMMHSKNSVTTLLRTSSSTQPSSYETSSSIIFPT